MQTISEANQYDPCTLYFHDTPDAKNTPGKERLERLKWNLVISQWVRVRTGITVNGGRAVAVVLPAPVNTKPRRPFDRLLDRIHTVVIGVLDKVTRSKEQQKRLDEISSKLDAIVEATLGERVKEMFSVNALSTHPAYQRRGYGSALVNAITHQADIEGRATYLLSSNIANTGFYNSLGFITVAEAQIGSENPTWHKPPIPVPLMVREPKLAYAREKE